MKIAIFVKKIKTIKTTVEVERFLSVFMPKFEIWGIFFLNREKNIEALKELGITSSIREEVIRGLEVRDYIDTLSDSMNSFGDMWVFGKDYEGNELYIKIALGRNENLTTHSNENSRRMPGEKPFHRRKSK